jgi:AcrR family transcriptional regulator
VAITMAVKEAGAVRPSARERLLAAANELFYNEGVHTVGIDRVIEQAGVAKASLYNTFGSKDELVRAYLETRHASVAERITQAVERYDTPRERLLAVFEGQGELFAQPDYRGCAFARASAESHPGDLVEQAAEAYRRWVRALPVAGSPRGCTPRRPRRPARPAPPRPSCSTRPWPAGRTSHLTGARPGHLRAGSWHRPRLRQEGPSHVSPSRHAAGR